MGLLAKTTSLGALLLHASPFMHDRKSKYFNFTADYMNLERIL